MKTRYRIGAALGLLLLAGGPVVAQQATNETERTQRMEHKFELAQEYFGECKHTEAAEFDDIRPYLKGFTDMEVLTQIMADPVKATRLMRIVSDPRTIHVMMKCSSEPVMWDTWMRGMTDINKMFRASLVFMNPMTYVNWMMAPFRPEVYSSMFGMVSPDNLNRWGDALVNPAFYQPMYEPLTSLNWYTPRLNWIIDPASYEPLLNVLTLGTDTPAAPAE
jgi:hypothetical protein